MTDNVIYCGKGTRKEYIVKSGKHKNKKCIYDRAYNNKDRPYKIDDTIEVFKVKYFNNKDEALKYEEFLTNWYKKCGQCWYNDSIGAKPSEETKEKMAETQRGEKSHCFKGYIYCPELDMTFEGTMDAVRQCKELGVKIHQQHISMCINGKLKTHGYVIRDEKKVRLTWKRINSI